MICVNLCYYNYNDNNVERKPLVNLDLTLAFSFLTQITIYIYLYIHYISVFSFYYLTYLFFKTKLFFPRDLVRDFKRQSLRVLSNGLCVVVMLN